MCKMDDGAGIYTLGNMPGTIIRGNYVHDCKTHNARGRAQGIYLDEGSGLIEVTGNLVYNVANPMFHNNRSQNRIATCKEHDNFFGGNPAAAKPIVENAGLEPKYQDLLKTP